MVGGRIGEWVVEERLEGDGRFRCHRFDSPFRKAVLTAFRGMDRSAAEQQASHLARLQHPNIGGVLGATLSGEELYVIAELVQGASLRAFHGDVGSIPLRTSLTLGFEIADALVTAHERGVVHGDIRPENILLGLDGKARLVGFERMGTSDDLSRAASYTAPELQRGAPPTPASDAFAFGVVLFELFTAAGAPLEPSPDRSRSLDEALPRPIRELVASMTHPSQVARSSLAKARQTLQQQLMSLTMSLTPTREEQPASDDEVVEAVLPTHIGRYSVVREIGRGGVGVVYEGVDPVLQRPVALKVLIAGAWARPREVQRFKVEAQAVARLDHPNIVKIMDIGGDLDGAWFAMEFVDGPSLAEHLAKNGPMAWRDAARMASQLARGLNHAHAAGILHRDVKPNNVLLDGTRPKLADFGLALDEASDATRLTGTGQILGTPTYMSPEQASGDLAQLGPQTDVHGLGVLLYEALTTKVPFEGATPLQVLAAILAGDPVPLRRRAPELPRELETVVAKALRREPRDRYVSAAAFADDLDRLLAGQAVRATQETAWQRFRRGLDRYRLPLVMGGGLAAAVLAVGATGGWGFMVWSQHRRQADAAAALASTRLGMAEAIASGDPEAAEAAFRTFVTRPEHLGTSAVVDAWLGYAADRQGDEQLSALSSAYLAATDLTDLERTLVALTEAAHQQRAFPLVARLGELVTQRHPNLAPRIRSWVRDALVAQRHLASAAALLPEDHQAVALSRWSSAVRTDWEAARVYADPTPGRYFVGSRDTLVATDGLLRQLPGSEAAFYPGWSESVSGSQQTTLLLLGRGSDQPTSWTFDGTRFTPGPSLALRLPSEAARMDLDGDGQDEIWVGSGRALYRVDPGGETWQLSSAHSETNASNSEISDVIAVDAEGTGSADLVVSLAEWGAYDVRRLRWDPAAGALTLVDRIRLGTVEDLAVTQSAAGQVRVAACKQNLYANLRVFPESAPFGEPKGVYELSFQADRPVQKRLALAADCRSVTSGDVDGDGLSDLIVSNDERTLIGLRRGDDTFAEVTLENTTFAALVQADGDPELELVVRDTDDDHRAWILGVAGAADTMPPLVPETTVRIDPPPSSQAFRGAWSRAEDLVALGRLRDAEGAYRELAALRWGTEEGHAALLRAADLAFSRDAFTEAAELFLKADAAGIEGALAAAIRARRADRDEPGELELLSRLRARGPLDEESSDRLAHLLPFAAQTLEVTFDQPPGPEWSLPDPLKAYHDEVAQQLVLEPDRAGELLRLPLIADSPWLAITLDGTIDRTDWGSRLQFMLVRRGTNQAVFRLEVAGRGGGEVVTRRIVCLDRHGIEFGGAIRGGPGVPLRATLRTQSDGSKSCSAEEATEWGRNGSGETREVALGEALDFVVSAHSDAGAASKVTLRHLTLTGVHVDETMPPAPRPTGARAELAARVRQVDVAGTLELLDTLPQDDANAARDWLLHTRLASFGPAIRAADPAGWYATLAAAWAVPMSAHGRRDAEVREVLSQWTEGVESWVGDDPAEVAEVQSLLLSKGAAALHTGRINTARLALRRGVDLPIPTDDTGESATRWSRRSYALVDLAEAELASGDPEAALRALSGAMAQAPAPQIVADVARTRASLAPLHADPRWRSMFGIE